MFDGSDVLVSIVSMALGALIGSLFGKDITYIIKKLKTKGDNSSIGITQHNQRKLFKRRK